MATAHGSSWMQSTSAVQRVWMAFAVFGCCFPAIVVADIAPDPLSGGVNFSATTKEVEMSEESVVLTISATKCITNAVFLMKNLTDSPVTMEVGFPFAYPDDLQDFQVKVDGQPAQDVGDKSLGRRQKWKVWTMTFPASKVTKVEVEYWNELQSRYSWTSGIDSVPTQFLNLTPWKTKPKGEATEEDQRQYNALAERLQHRQVGYILTTGAGWAGNIGKCRIEATFDGFTSDSLITRFPLSNVEYLPRDPQVLKTGLVWELKDFEPKHDIYFQISPNITHQELKELTTRTLKQHPHHPPLTLLLGDYCKTSEEKQQQEEMMDAMFVAWSKQFAIDGPDYLDKSHAQYSFRVWFMLRNLTIQQHDTAPISDARRQKLLPTIKKLAERLQSQMPPEPLTRTDRLNEHQVKTFRRESQQMLDWVAAQK